MSISLGCELWGGGSDGGGSGRRSLRRSIRSSGDRDGLATTGGASQDATSRRAGRRRRMALPTPSTSSPLGRCREAPAGGLSERRVRIHQSQSPATVVGSTTAVCSSAWLRWRGDALDAWRFGMPSGIERRGESSGTADCRWRGSNRDGTRQWRCRRQVPTASEPTMMAVQVQEQRAAATLHKDMRRRGARARRSSRT